MEAQQHGDQLKRGLKNRHIQLIALGGAIGTGLFLGSASVIQSAGPGIILGYAIAGFIAFLIMRSWVKWSLKSQSQAPSATLPINTGAALPVSPRAGTTGCCTFWLPWPSLPPSGNTFSSGIPRSQPGPPQRLSSSLLTPLT